MTRKQNVFEQNVEDKVIFLDSLHNKTIGDLIDFMDKNPNVEIFDWISNNTIVFPKVNDKGIIKYLSYNGI